MTSSTPPSFPTAPAPWNVDRLHHEYQIHEVNIVHPPTDYEWGMREMLVEELDGHRLRMSQGLP